jgi:two-component system sensor histidine kinase CpxA
VRRLFLRIFLAFWLAMAAVATLLIVSSPLFTRSRPGVERWQRDVVGTLHERLERSARIVGGSEERQSGSEHRGGPRIPVFLLRPDGTSAVGSDVPSEIAAFARRVDEAGEEISERTGAYHIAGRPAARPDGERVVLVAAVRRPPSLVDLLEPGVLGWRLLALTAVVGALCFWIARTLTSPVEKLRGVVRSLAGGDLSARVAPRMAARKDEIGDLARDFDAMAARIEALVGAQQRLVRDVSHELRSPLARLAVALELARKRAGESATEQLDRIELEAGRLDALIGQLLTLSRLEAADAPAAHERVDLGELVDGVADDAAFEASARGVQVAVDRGDGCAVEGDPDALRSAVENVVRNAVAYSADGGEVRVAAERAGAAVAVRVSDGGPGVPEEHLEAVFQPFFRVEEARDRQHGGAGLGLAIASRAVRLHGGTITARNRPTGGLEVELRLPAA